MNKKFKKAIVSPIKFLKDSWFLKFNHMEDVKRTKNLFVISHLGQLAQIEAVITKEALLNCVLVILYTPKNTKMPKQVQQATNKKLFNKVFLLKIPSYPNKIVLKNLTIINNSYKMMLDQIKPGRLFLLSFEKHYSMLATRAKERKIQVNLVEEGTATYKYSSIEEATNLINNSLTKEEKRVATLIKALPIFGELRTSLNIYSDFDVIYAAYPSLLSDIFKPKEYKEFFLYEKIKADQKTKNIQNTYNISGNDIIFLNQRYPYPEPIYANIIINLLSQYSEKYKSKVFIKLHPKDSESLKLSLKEEIIKTKNNNIIIIDEYGFLVEGLISLSSPHSILALTSTGLVYGNKISPRTNPVSIYPLFREKLLRHIEYTNKVFSESDEHFSIIKKFKNIKFLEKESEI